MAASTSHGSASRASPTAPTVEISSNLRFAGFPSDYATLPTVAFVIPNLNHDMHNGKPRAKSICTKNSTRSSSPGWPLVDDDHLARLGLHEQATPIHFEAGRHELDLARQAYATRDAARAGRLWRGTSIPWKFAPGDHDERSAHRQGPCSVAWSGRLNEGGGTRRASHRTAHGQ